MSTPVIKKQLSWLKNPFIYIALFTFISRLPYFFKVDINWDEATFILLGQSVVDGHLPYTDLLDNKSPLLWFIFAALIWLSGKSIALLRLMGAIYLAATAGISYLIANKVWSKRIAIIISILLVLMLDISPSGQAIMSEHLALLPLMTSLWLLTNFKRSHKSLFLSGFCLGLATLVRLNLAYTVLFVGIFVFVESCQSFKFRIKNTFLRCVSFSLGFFLTLFLVAIPYLIQGQQESLYVGLIQAPLNYIAPKNLLIALFEQLFQFFIIDVLGARISVAFTLIFLAFFVLFISQIYVLLSKWTHLKIEEKKLYKLSGLYLTSIGFSIVSSGVFYSHYVMQMIPFMVLIATPSIEAMFEQRQKIKLAIAALLMLVFVVHTGIQSSNTIAYCLEQQSCTHGRSLRVAAYLQETNPEQKPVWLTKFQMAHWFTGTTPIIPDVVHPSNIKKEGLLQAWYGDNYSSLDAVNKVFEARPFLILMNDYTNYFANMESQQLLSKNIEENYLLIDNIQGVDVYQLK